VVKVRAIGGILTRLCVLSVAIVLLFLFLPPGFFRGCFRALLFWHRCLSFLGTVKTVYLRSGIGHNAKAPNHSRLRQDRQSRGRTFLSLALGRIDPPASQIRARWGPRLLPQARSGRCEKRNRLWLEIGKAGLGTLVIHDMKWHRLRVSAETA
jgi:hypothetical protein